MVDNPAEWERGYAYGTHIGMKLTEWAQDFARVELPIAPHILNRHGMPHGGVHASILDTALGYAGCFTGDPERRQMCLTLNLSVNYVGAAKGRLLVAEGRRTGGGRSTFFAEGKIVDDTGVLVASAAGVFRYISKS